MDEERFNQSIRKFLKVVGVTSQREIERAVRERLESGELRDVERVPARITLEIEEVGLRHVVDGEIEL